MFWDLESQSIDCSMFYKTVRKVFVRNVSDFSHMLMQYKLFHDFNLWSNKIQYDIKSTINVPDSRYYAPSSYIYGNFLMQFNGFIFCGIGLSQNPHVNSRATNRNCMHFQMLLQEYQVFCHLPFI